MSTTDPARPVPSHAPPPPPPAPNMAPVANALTLAGALPFIALTAMIPLARPLGEWLGNYALAVQLGWVCGLALVVYAGVILSFLGGIRFGFAVLQGRPLPLALSVLPSLAGALLALVGWVGLFTGFETVAAIALAALALCFLAQWLWDRGAAGAPSWFGPMRTRVTLIVVPTLLVAALLTWLAA